ncbi:efflux RND transporter periplasmic adaptor subunit [Desulfovibrio sp. Huiquan2017]|uniref:efflux RND transporter periplasmic adaptor subunit n=1 Tax=Desulfovibrio sp. Huiquan2017 TaxID=2816861 RepID=UPI001A93926E|nr:efflux RND transporter periplasmic adaptor subunit [Desulfovibrio sp. Huiquan2017]
MKRIIALLSFLLLLTGGCREEQPGKEIIRPVRAYRIDRNVMPETRYFPGKVRAAKKAGLAFRISGQIVRLDVKEGDSVREGQLIAQLDQRDYQAAIADLEAKLLGAKSVLTEATLDLRRKRQLLTEKIIAQSVFDTAQSAYETSLASVRSLEQDIRRAHLNLQYTNLKAPFSGIIAVKHVDNHEFVQAKEPIAQCEDVSSLDVIVNIPEAVWIKATRRSDSGGLALKARAAFESYPGESFPLVLKEYQTKANSETQTYQVTLGMENPGAFRVQPGMTAEVFMTMPADAADAEISVPISAVVGEPDGAKNIWIISAEGTVTRREVKLGRLADGAFVVEAGLAQGETVITAGSSFLHEGMKVRVLKGKIGGRE